jgi:hypothetical protein
VKKDSSLEKEFKPREILTYKVSVSRIPIHPPPIKSYEPENCSRVNECHDHTIFQCSGQTRKNTSVDLAINDILPLNFFSYFFP